MKQYLQLVETILATGTWQPNRTGIRTIAIPGATLRFDLQRDGFPAITTRRLPFKSAVGELIGFLRASRSAAEFRALGCKVWDQNANENAQWLANPYRIEPDYLGHVRGERQCSVAGAAAGVERALIGACVGGGQHRRQIRAGDMNRAGGIPFRLRSERIARVRLGGRHTGIMIGNPFFLSATERAFPIQS